MYRSFIAKILFQNRGAKVLILYLGVVEIFLHISGKFGCKIAPR